MAPKDQETFINGQKYFSNYEQLDIIAKMLTNLVKFLETLEGK